jgi:hypothetical protein
MEYDDDDDILYVDAASLLDLAEVSQAATPSCKLCGKPADAHGSEHEWMGDREHRLADACLGAALALDDVRVAWTQPQSENERLLSAHIALRFAGGASIYQLADDYSTPADVVLAIRVALRMHELPGS